MKKDIHYEFHHMGIPTSEIREDEIYSSSAKMYTSDNKGIFKIQWHRFENGSPLHPLLKTLPHIAFKVDNLNAAIKDKEILLGPYEPIDDYFVAVINDGGVPIELIQTTLNDNELWQRARNKQGSLYKANTIFQKQIE